MLKNGIYTSVKLNLVVAKTKASLSNYFFLMDIALVCISESIINFSSCDELFKICIYFDIFMYGCLLHVYLNKHIRYINIYVC